MSAELAERDLAVDVGSEPLPRVLLLERLLPEGRRELEHTALRPARQQAEEIPQVGPRLEAVHLTAGQERDESRIDLCALVASHENPVFLPTASRRSSRSETLLWIGSLPSSRKRSSAFC